MGLLMLTAVYRELSGSMEMPDTWLPESQRLPSSTTTLCQSAALFRHI